MGGDDCNVGGRDGTTDSRRCFHPFISYYLIRIVDNMVYLYEYVHIHKRILQDEDEERLKTTPFPVLRESLIQEQFQEYFLASFVSSSHEERNKKRKLRCFLALYSLIYLVRLCFDRRSVNLPVRLPVKGIQGRECGSHRPPQVLVEEKWTTLLLESVPELILL